MTYLFSTQFTTLLGSALMGVLGALLLGKAIRNLLILPIEWLAKRSRNKVDDEIVREVRVDLGLTPESPLDKLNVNDSQSEKEKQ